MQFTKCLIIKEQWPTFFVHHETKLTTKLAAVRERARSQSLTTTTSDASCSSEVDDSSEASTTTESSSSYDPRMTNGKASLGVPSVSATVTIKLSPSRAVITDTDVFATVCPNAVKKPVPTASPVPNRPTPNTLSVNVPKIIAKPMVPVLVQPKSVTATVIVPSVKPQVQVISNNKFTPSAKAPMLSKRQSTEDDLSDTDALETDSEMSEEEGEEDEEVDEEVEEEESEEEESEKLSENVVRPRKEYELDDFQMIKTIGESFILRATWWLGFPIQLRMEIIIISGGLKAPEGSYSWNDTCKSMTKIGHMLI